LEQISWNKSLRAAPRAVFPPGIDTAWRKR
jgi:hypothetical protein